MSAAAIAMIPSFSHPGGATAASSTPSVTQLSADSSAAAAPPASDLCQIHATANSAAVIAIDRADPLAADRNLLLHRPRERGGRERRDRDQRPGR